MCLERAAWKLHGAGKIEGAMSPGAASVLKQASVVGAWSDAHPEMQKVQSLNQGSGGGQSVPESLIVAILFLEPVRNPMGTMMARLSALGNSACDLRAVRSVFLRQRNDG